MRLPLGPGALVTAAFIGPGTMTVCTLAGAQFGYALVWAVLFSALATMVLQEMSVRLGLLGGAGLGEALVAPGLPGFVRWLSAGLIFCALAIGNAAYQAGNVTGGALGLVSIAGAGALSQHVAVLLVAGIAAFLLATGGYRLIETLLVGLVGLMSLSFALSLLIVQPDWAALASGLRPSLPDGSLVTVIALIGTTIVPYNLFLQAAAVRQRWPEQREEALAAAINDTRVSIGLGGIVSLLVLSTAAASLFAGSGSVLSGSDLAGSLEPAFGAGARILVGFGLAAAGLSSAITAPLATGYVVCELLGRPRSGPTFRIIALLVVLIGSGIALSGVRPVEVILLAQFANGILLPFAAGFLLLTMNRKSVMGVHTNGHLRNLGGAAVLCVVCLLGVRLILRALGIWP